MIGDWHLFPTESCSGLDSSSLCTSVCTHAQPDAVIMYRSARRAGMMAHSCLSYVPPCHSRLASLLSPYGERLDGDKPAHRRDALTASAFLMHQVLKPRPALPPPQPRAALMLMTHLLFPAHIVCGSCPGARHPLQRAARRLPRVRLGPAADGLEKADLLRADCWPGRSLRCRYSLRSLRWNHGYPFNGTRNIFRSFSLC